MSTAVEDPPLAGGWIMLGSASRRLGVSPHTVRRLISEGRLTERHVPGAWPRVRADEVDELARRSTRPAAVD
jgi:excisionase family DNA binding protein